MRLRWWRRRKPSSVPVPGSVHEMLVRSDQVSRRIASMMEQRFVADMVLGPGYLREQPSRVRRAYRNLRERVARSGEVE